MYCNRLKKKNLLDFCENLLENLLKSPKKSKSKSAMTPVLDPLTLGRCFCGSKGPQASLPYGRQDMPRSMNHGCLPRAKFTISAISLK